MKKIIFLILWLVGGAMFAQQNRPDLQKIHTYLKMLRIPRTHNFQRPYSPNQLHLDSLITSDDAGTITEGRYFHYDPAHDENTLLEYSMDYMIGAVYDSLIYAYDANVNLTRLTYRYYDDTGQLGEEDFKIFQYDAQGHLTVRIDSLNDYSLNEFKSKKIYFSNYNAAGLPGQIIVDTLDHSSGNYVHNIKLIASYDSANRLSESEMWQWDASSNSWKRYAKLIRTYDANGNMTQELIRAWVVVTWADFDKTDITIQTQGGNEVHTVLHQSKESGSWENVDKQIYTFDSSTDRILSEEDYDWDGTNNEWDGDIKTVYQYALNGNTLVRTETSYDWDDAANSWNAQAYEKNEIYEDTGTQFNDIVWPGSLSYMDREEQIYFEAWEKYSDFYPQYKPDYVIYYYYDTNSGQWETDYREDYYYSTMLPVGKTHRVAVKLYPNPARDYITFRLPDNARARIRLFDAQGHLLKSADFRKSVKLDVSDLPAGIYFYRILTDGKTGTGSWIKE